MLKILLCLALAVALVASTLSMAVSQEEKAAGEAKLVHDVYFTLKDSTPANRKKLVEACKKYLTHHEGTVSFSAGVLAEDLKREVNVVDWDVALHLVFKNKAAHDKYQVDPRHLKFIDENKASWAKVRVFDSYVTD